MTIPNPRRFAVLVAALLGVLALFLLVARLLGIDPPPPIAAWTVLTLCCGIYEQHLDRKGAKS